MTTLELTGNHLTLKEVAEVAVQGRHVALSKKSEKAILASRHLLEQHVGDDSAVYGVNTGFGLLADTKLGADDLIKLQRNIIRSHAAGMGPLFSTEQVRAAMLSRLNVHARGLSGCQLEIATCLQSMLNLGVTPIVHKYGSVGASGDLAPMSEIALVVMGEGEAEFQGERMVGAEAFAKAGIKPVQIKARDGLSLLNGCNLSLGCGSLAIMRLRNVLLSAEIAAAMSFEGLTANVEPLDQRVHQVRGFKGSELVAEHMRALLAKGDLLQGDLDVNVQDAYSMRATPQVIGAAWDGLEYVWRQLTTELNSAADNPVFLADEQAVLSGANFHGMPISLPLDFAATLATSVSVLSERRLNRLLNPKLSGLNAFLAKSPGVESGFMASQYTAGHLITQQRLLSAPASTLSLPACADQEDFVSMAMNAALKLEDVVTFAQGVVGIELMCAAQAMEFRSHQKGGGTLAAFELVRSKIASLNEDRVLVQDQEEAAKLAGSSAFWQQVFQRADITPGAQEWFSFFTT